CLATLLLTGGVASAAQVSFGIQIGPPPRPRAVRVVPRQPGPGYVWVDGYWSARNGRYAWRDGYWARPSYPDSYWVAPYYENGRYCEGRWARWDQGRDRDGDHDRGRDGGRDRDYRDRDDRR